MHVTLQVKMSAEISHDQSSATDKTVTLDHEKQVFQHNKVDAALEFLNHESGTVTEVDEKALVRKIDWRIVPLMCKCSYTRKHKKVG